MYTRKSGACALAVVAVSLLGMVKAAEAAPLNAAAKAPVSPEAGANLLVNVADYYTYRERRVVVREYDNDDVYVDRDYYDGPDTYVYSESRYVDDGYYEPHVHHHGGVRVRAPFVDIEIP